MHQTSIAIFCIGIVTPYPKGLDVGNRGTRSVVKCSLMLIIHVQNRPVTALWRTMARNTRQRVLGIGSETIVGALVARVFNGAVSVTTVMRIAFELFRTYISARFISVKGSSTPTITGRASRLAELAQSAILFRSTIAR